MLNDRRIAEYLEEIREEVCRHCIERPDDGPPCWPVGKSCGVERNLPRIIEAIHAGRGSNLEPYVDHLHHDVCDLCEARDSEDCPCPLEYLQVLVIEAIAAVDERRPGPVWPITC